MKPIYFDSAATTPVMNSVIEKMTPYFSKLFGNPSAAYSLASFSRKAIDEALEIERFFRSGWYSQLTSVDGEYLIKRLQDEVRQSESIRGRKNKSNRR